MASLGETFVVGAQSCNLYVLLKLHIRLKVTSLYRTISWHHLCLKRVYQHNSLGDFRSIRLWLEVKGTLDEVHYPECYFEQDWEQTEEQTNVGRETAGFSLIWNFSCILLELATWYADSSAQYSQKTGGSSVSLSLALCYCGPQGLQHKPTFARTWAHWERFKSVSTSPSNALIYVVRTLRVMFSNYFWWVKYLIFFKRKYKSQGFSSDFRHPFLWEAAFIPTVIQRSSWIHF